MNKLLYSLLAVGLFSLYSCTEEDPMQENQASSFEVKISCLSDIGLSGLELKVDMDDGTAYVLTTDENGIISFDENLETSCYSLRLEKDEDKGPRPDDLDIQALSAYIQNPASSNRPAVVYDINRDQVVDNADLDELNDLIADLENSPNFPWAFILSDGSDDLTCLNAADFENQLQIIAYRLSDMDGSDCD